MNTASEKIDEILKRRPEILSENCTLNLDDLISKFPKVIEDVKLGKFKGINQIVGFVLKNNPSIDAKDLYNKIYLNLVGEPVKEKIVKEILKPEPVIYKTKIVPAGVIYKNEVGELCMESKYLIDGKVYSIWKLTEEEMTNPKVLEVKEILDNLIIKT